MRRTLLPFCLAAAFTCGAACADEAPGMPPSDEPLAPAELPAPMVQAVTPEQAQWIAPPELPGLQAAWLIGSEKEPGPYALRLRLAQGGRIGVHVHPDDRITTVLRGTLYVGFGTIFDETRVQPVTAGSVYLAPADQPHYIWARDGDVEYQESGFAPTATNFGMR